VNRDRFTWHDGDLKIIETTIDGEPALFLTPREKVVARVGERGRTQDRRSPGLGVPGAVLSQSG
jgi:hypothetical protein